MTSSFAWPALAVTASLWGVTLVAWRQAEADLKVATATRAATQWTRINAQIEARNATAALTRANARLRELGEPTHEPTRHVIAYM